MALLGGIGGGITRDVMIAEVRRPQEPRLHHPVPGGRGGRLPDRGRKLKGKSQRELRDLGLLVEEPDAARTDGSRDE